MTSRSVVLALMTLTSPLGCNGSLTDGAGGGATGSPSNGTGTASDGPDAASSTGAGCVPRTCAAIADPCGDFADDCGGMIHCNDSCPVEGTFFVGGAGASDDNDGTPAAPFATIQKAASVAAPGNFVRVRTGTYRETITPAASGTDGAPITFMPDGDAVVTVSGLEAVSDDGWTQHQGDIWVKDVAMPIADFAEDGSTNTALQANQVFQGGEMQIQARWPDAGSVDGIFERSNLRGRVDTQSFGTTSISDSAMPGDLAGGWVWITGWYLSHTRRITSQDGSTIRYDGIIDYDKFQKYYYVTGKLGLLTQEKEWHAEGGKLYFWQTGGGSPTSVEIKARNWGFDLRGKAFITIAGLGFLGCDPVVSDEASTSTIVEGIRARFLNHAFLHPNPGNDAFDTARQAGLKLLGAGSVLRDSELEYAAANAVWMGTDTRLENNLIRRVAYDGGGGSAITMWPDTHGQVVVRNTLSEAGRTVIELNAGGDHRDMEIAYNDMHDFGMLTHDSGAIYAAWLKDLTGTRIHHNWIHASRASKADPNGVDGIQCGLYFDQASGPVTVDHNVLWDNAECDFYAEIRNEERTCGGHRLYNNTFASTPAPSPNPYKSYVTYWSSPHDVQRNNIYGREIVIRTRDENDHSVFLDSPGDIEASLREGDDPAYVGTGEGGLAFRLQPGSPAVDAGMVLDGFTDDAVGAPDIGAYELGGVEWTAGRTP